MKYVRICLIKSNGDSYVIDKEYNTNSHKKALAMGVIFARKRKGFTSFDVTIIK